MFNKIFRRNNKFNVVNDVEQSYIDRTRYNHASCQMTQLFCDRWQNELDARR